MRILAFFLTAIFSNLALADQITYFPDANLAQYVYDKLNISTFRNSLNPRRMKNQLLFSELELRPSSMEEKAFTIESSDWRYEVIILRRKDINKDNIEDLEICFRDSSKVGTYNAQQPLLITQLSESSNIVALGFEVSGCERYAK